MSLVSAGEEFAELMPHRIRIKGSTTGHDDYGQSTDDGLPRTYRCLIDDTTSTARTAAGEEITVALTAYVAPVPVETPDGLPVDIESTEEIEILVPRQQSRPLNSVERHYDSVDGEGILYVLVLRFT